MSPTDPGTASEEITARATSLQDRLVSRFGSENGAADALDIAYTTLRRALRPQENPAKMTTWSKRLDQIEDALSSANEHNGAAVPWDAVESGAPAGQAREQLQPYFVYANLYDQSGKRIGRRVIAHLQDAVPYHITVNPDGTETVSSSPPDGPSERETSRSASSAG